MNYRELLIVLGIVVVASLLNQPLAVAQCPRDLQPRALQADPLGGATAFPGTLRARSDELNTARMFAITRPSIVHINVVREDGRRGHGSGFVWDNVGHVITNAHVVDNASRIEVLMTDAAFTRLSPNRGMITTGTRTYGVHEVRLIGKSVWHDLAVIKLDEREVQLRPINVDLDSLPLVVGQHAYAIGSPLAEAFRQTLTAGIVSGLPLEVSRREFPNVPLFDMVQIDAAINPGNSGGPLLSSMGNLIGVNSNGFTENFNFAVRLDTVCRVVPKLIGGGRYSRPRFGGYSPVVAFDPQDPQRQPYGVYLRIVPPGAGASTAGLVGVAWPFIGLDVQILNGLISRELLTVDIIERVDGIRVYSTKDLWRILDYYEPSASVTLQVLRTGQGERERRSVTVTLSEAPPPGDPLDQLTHPHRLW